MYATSGTIMYNLTENLGNLTESIDLISWGSGVGGGGGGAGDGGGPS